MQFTLVVVLERVSMGGQGAGHQTQGQAGGRQGEQEGLG